MWRLFLDDPNNTFPSILTLEPLLTTTVKQIKPNQTSCGLQKHQKLANNL